MGNIVALGFEIRKGIVHNEKKTVSPTDFSPQSMILPRLYLRKSP